MEEMHPLLSGKVLSRKDKERDRDQEAAELSKMTVVCNETARRDYEVDHNDAAKRNYDYYRDEEQWSPDGVALNQTWTYVHLKIKNGSELVVIRWETKTLIKCPNPTIGNTEA